MNAQQLKNAILQEAIEGRLVPQDPNDEPASVLLARIRKEKERLVKEGKVYKKKDTLAFYDEDNWPFEIPTNWVWAQLSDISIIQEGAGIRKYQYTKEGVQLLCVTNILDGKVDLSKKMLYVSEKEYKDKYLHLTPQIGDIVTACSGGSWGKVAIFDCNKTVMLNTSTLRLRFFSDLADNKYLYYIAQSKFLKNQLADQLVGIQPNFGYAHYSRICIPLPPLAEQHRIVTKIEELLPKVEEYGKAQDALNKLNADLPERLKKSILQEAIEGRLVPQDPNDEPASVLLDKIRQEKAQLVKSGKLKKKDLIETPITEDEIPFEIPESWEWVRLPYISTNSLGKTLNGGKTIGATKKYLCSINVYWNRIDLLKVKETPFNELDCQKYRLEKGDLLICEGGDYGRSAVWNKDDEMYYQNALHRIRFYNMINPYFYMYCMEVFKSISLLEEVAKGMTIKHLTQDALYSLAFPLPPLAEQHRIVEKLEQLLGEIDKLKK